MPIISRRRKPGSDGPSPQQLAEALAKVGHAGLLVGEDRIALLRRGAAITLNGIAQGFATDRVVERLREAGLSTTLVNMGEIRAIGARPEGTPWRVGLGDPDRPGVLTETVDLVDRAVATSAGAGFRFDSKGRFTHLFDPATGRSPQRYRTRERDGADRHRSGRVVDRVQPDAVVAISPTLWRSGRTCRPASPIPTGTLIVYGA